MNAAAAAAAAISLYDKFAQNTFFKGKYISGSAE
jgi:hypothetical protein